MNKPIKAKYGAEQQQEENPVCFTEMTTIIKSLFNIRDWNLLPDTVAAAPTLEEFRARLASTEDRTQQTQPTSHKVMKVVPSPMCPCGEAEQDTTHLSQSCKIHQALRDKIWHSETPLKEKLYGPVDALQKTIRFVEETGIQV
ncbi:Hypothetical predicted protein [Mytilus galloprovincialis]|uniref:Uncharacterized protein n=1 Tax=Mytilus galloprovincialis TaxID=29158 RepID=A0A8B6BXB8_MYTGA|nr:Hypothetical predicted protein [Mytilus galloprovincialis]